MLKISVFAIVLFSVQLLGAPVYLGESEGISHFVEEVPVSKSALNTVENWYAGTIKDVYDDFTGDKDDSILPDFTFKGIINLGKQIWSIVEKNQPVLNVKYNYANALPQGVRSAEDLDGFSNLQTRGFRTYGVNYLGVHVYDVTYTAVHRYNGNYKGNGRYLENVTLLPQAVDVAWGYEVNIAVDKVSATNVGTRENPIGAVLIEADMSVSTVLQKSQRRQLLEFRGDSNAVKVTGSL